MEQKRQKALQLVANTLRCLAADEVQAAKSGHPGVALSLADVMAVLWLYFLKVDGAAPTWADRDRFVMSGGHGSSLLYALEHLAGYDLSLEDLKHFRQLGSKTPGHPEYGVVPGVETTTGPLGQGLGAAVGMAIAERMMAERFNTPEMKLVDHRTWVTCGDGDMEEGISHEAASLAGTLGLNKLVAIYDSNRISIEGDVADAMADDTANRFRAYGWQVCTCDGHNFDSIARALHRAMRSQSKPVLVICNTVIGKGSPNKADSASCHGAPLGEDEVRLMKEALGFNPDEHFAVSEAVREKFAARQAQMGRMRRRWERQVRKHFEAHPRVKRVWEAMHAQELPKNFAKLLPAWEDKPISTRVASGKVLNALAPSLPWLVGG